MPEAPSAGTYLRQFTVWEPGVTLGTYLGYDILERWPFGIRIDGRFGLGSSQERAVFLGVELGLLPAVALPVLPFLGTFAG